MFFALAFICETIVPVFNHVGTPRFRRARVRVRIFFCLSGTQKPLRTRLRQGWSEKANDVFRFLVDGVMRDGSRLFPDAAARCHKLLSVTRLELRQIYLPNDQSWHASLCIRRLLG